MRGLIAAFKYLTFWGTLSEVGPQPEDIGAGTIYFPLVGLVLGLMLAIVNYALSLYLDSEVLSVLLIALLFAATGGTHIEGTKRTFDAPAPIVDHPVTRRSETYGFVAVLFVFLFKIGATDAIDERIALSLFFTPIAARWALVLSIYGYHDRCEEMPRRIAKEVKFSHLLLATGVTLGLAFYLLGRKGLWLGLSLSVFALLTRSLLHRRHAILTHDHFGAIIELSEALSLILLASL
ncbi:MAG TPA: adenosylcobinamide-GDP ribazoletransferase [Terriglobales bacterium]|jgi:adenosylcobinamide-GDP ribazoletransferase|nr:adenosylcobinamide-GDP ribazoletransferase [Terriglobales bacterium]